MCQNANPTRAESPFQVFVRMRKGPKTEGVELDLKGFAEDAEGAVDRQTIHEAPAPPG